MMGWSEVSITPDKKVYLTEHFFEEFLNMLKRLSPRIIKARVI